MNAVGFHNFLGKCGMEIIESVFPKSEMRHITAKQMEEAMTFEGSIGHEHIVQFLFNYLLELEKYEEGTETDQFSLAVTVSSV